MKLSPAMIELKNLVFFQQHLITQMKKEKMIARRRKGKGTITSQIS
jgi:hypothetical protein